jgi:hypothetical protein
MKVYTFAMNNIIIDKHGSLGVVWFAGWLFTIGFLQLTFWKGVLAIIVWPYFIGVALTMLPH